MQVREALHQARDVLEAISDSPASDARVLLADTLGASPTWLLAHDDQVLPSEAERVFVDRLRRCAGGEPLPYVLGWWEFYGRRFSVSPSVLIPRPETELLVDLGLVELRRRGAPARVIDVGTGSGCIAVSLAAAAPGFFVVATDVSRPALEVARSNAKAHKVQSQLRLVQASLLVGLKGGWDLVCANLPYVAAERLPELAVSCREPRLALDGGHRGLGLTTHLVRSLKLGLAPGGLALLEIDQDQAEELMAVAHQSMDDAVAEIIVDLTGRPRVLQVQRSRRAA